MKRFSEISSKLFGFAMVMILVTGASSCIKGTGEKIEYLPVKSDKDSNWGMIGSDGKILFNDEFKNEPSMVVNNIFTVKEGKGYSVYTIEENKPKIVKGLEELADAGVMSEGVIPVSKKGSRIEYYDASGKNKFTLEPIKGHEIVGVSALFTEDRAVFATDEGKYGMINSDGKVVVEPKYGGISYIHDGYAIATEWLDPQKQAEAEEKEVEIHQYLIDLNGKEVFKVKGFSIIGQMQNGLIPAIKSDRYGYINKKGEFTKLPEKVKGMHLFNGKCFTFSNDEGKWGVMNIEGEIIVRPKYEGILLLTEKTFIAQADSEKFYIVNDEDERVKELDDAKNAFPIKELAKMYYGLDSDFNLIVNEGDNEYKLYTADGEAIDKKDYYEIGFNLTSWVVSDYFDASAAAKKLTDYVDDNGFDKVQLGQPLYKYIKGGSPSNYTGTDKYYFENLGSGYRYSLSGYAYTNSYVAKSTPVYRTETYGYYYTYSYQVFDHYNYSWNQSAVVDYINVTMNVLAEGQFGAVKSATANALKAKGFKVTKEDKSYSVLSNGKTVVFLSLSSSDDSSSMMMRMYKEADWSKVSASMINSANERYKSAVSDKANLKDEDEALEDSIAVEEVIDYPVAETAVAVEDVW